MIVRFAFECFADQDVFEFLKSELKFPLSPIHSFGQSEGVNYLLVKDRAHIAMVDEDPGRPHHRGRDQMAIVSLGEDVEWRKSVRAGIPRHLLVIKPDLEKSYFRCLGRLKMESAIARNVDELHGLLGKPRAKAHETFRAELKSLYDASRNNKTATFLTAIEDILRQILAPGQ